MLWDALVGARRAGSWAKIGEDDFFAGVIPEGYRPHALIPRNLVHVLDAGSLIAVDAALQAVESAGLGAGAADSRRFAVSDGLAYRAPGQATLFVPYGQAVARVLGIRGPVVEFGGADASGALAIAEAVSIIASGAADIVIAGASQTLQQPLAEHLRAQGLAGRDFAAPFDRAHAGCVPAEGAAYLVLESVDHARERGAVPKAILRGTGKAFDPGVEPLETSDAAEAGRVVQIALASAGVLQDQVDLILSCADGRPGVDFADGYGLKRTFGRHAYYAAVTASAGSSGQLLAASGPISLALAVESLSRQEAFPIAGFSNAEPDLELAYVRSREAHNLGFVLVTSLGLGGTNAAFVLERAGPEPG